MVITLLVNLSTLVTHVLCDSRVIEISHAYNIGNNKLYNIIGIDPSAVCTTLCTCEFLLFRQLISKLS